MRICYVVLSGVLPFSTGCGDAQDAQSSQTEGGKDIAVSAPGLETTGAQSREVATRLGWLEEHEGVVVGVVEVRSASGMQLGIRAVTNFDSPSNLAELMETGAEDAEGFAYSDVSGAWGDSEFETRYRYVKRSRQSRAVSAKAVRPRVLTTKSGLPEVSPSFTKALNDVDATGYVDVYVRLQRKFTTRLKPASAYGIASLYGAEQDFALRREAISARKSEATSIQLGLVGALEALGAQAIGGFWTSNAVSARVPRAVLREILKIPGVERVEADEEAEPSSPTQWDGEDIKAPGGLNSAIYHDSGYNGQAYSNGGGRMMRIGMIYTDGWYDHPGFRDAPGYGSRARVYDCTQNPCVKDQSKSAGVGEHDLKCGGLAAGSVRQGQLGDSNSDGWRTERTGPAEEPDIYFLEGTSSTSTKRAIELAIDLELDFLSASRGSTGSCTGQGASDLEETVMEAQLQNIISIFAAGNEGHSGGCNVRDPGDTPPWFHVGGVGSGSSTCTSSNYSTCAIWSGSAMGGMDATVDGQTSSSALSTIDVVVPACPQYYYTEYTANPVAPSDNYIHEYSGNSTCGTSYAAPQVAGAGIQIKDWFLANDYGAIGIEGRPFVVLLAMGDRQGTSGKLTTGFDDVYGGGRFQMRRFDGSDHTGVWGWETYSHVFSSEGASNHNLWGSGAESSSLNQVKVYMMFFEEDTTDIAKIDLRVQAGNCAGTSLGLDSSDDVKKMVRVGSSAAGEQLCARLNAIHLPAGESRRSHVFAYYSGDTAMR